MIAVLISLAVILPMVLLGVVDGRLGQTLSIIYGGSNVSRWRASAIHLFISAAIAGAFLALTLLMWYPQPYFEAAGAGYLLFILIGVDVTIGPLITLIIFKVGKPGLKFDLIFIAMAQVLALAYGGHTIWNARPAFVVFAIDRFNVVPAHGVIESSLGKAQYPQFARLSLTGPVLAAARLPEDRDKRHDLMFSALAGSDVETQPEFFEPYENQQQQVIARGQPLQRLIQLYPDQEDMVRNTLADFDRSLDEVLYLPLTATRRDMALVVDATSAEIVTALAINPW